MNKKLEISALWAMLRSPDWQLVTDVSGQYIVPIFKGIFGLLDP